MHARARVLPAHPDLPPTLTAPPDLGRGALIRAGADVNGGAGGGVGPPLALVIAGGPGTPQREAAVAMLVEVRHALAPGGFRPSPQAGAQAGTASDIRDPVTVNSHGDHAIRVMMMLLGRFRL